MTSSLGASRAGAARVQDVCAAVVDAMGGEVIFMPPYLLRMENT
jgi:hypothetical protein